MKNLVREKILNGEKAFGTFHELGSSSAIEVIGYAGVDYIVIDGEHGPFEPERVQEFVRASKSGNITPFVRVKDSERNSILKMLDVGAQGLIIPNIHTVEEVKKIVSYGKYFPLGNRGVAPSSGSSYWYAEYARNGLDNYFEISNRETLLLPQCETKGCLDNIEEILSIDGIDGIFVGPYDLSTALGKPGQFDDEEIVNAIDNILKACKNTNKFSFIYAGNTKDIKKNFELGYDSVTYSMDAIELAERYRTIIKELF